MSYQLRLQPYVLTVKITCKKHKQAKSKLGKAQTALLILKKQVKGAILYAWKLEESKWLRKVVEMKYYVDLINPYESQKKKGKYSYMQMEYSTRLRLC